MTGGIQILFDFNEALNDSESVEIELDDDTILEGKLFEGRVDSESIPSGWHVYYIRHSDNDWGKPISIEPAVLCNFFGVFITKNALKFPKVQYPWLSIRDFYYTGD